jgi:L-iditol 2-dehydrogenase
MRRAILREPGVAALEEAPTPTRAPEDYLLAVGACGICTWEQRVHRGAAGPHPFAGGHEIGAIVLEGPAGGLAPGTVVAVSRLPRCGECDECRRGFDNLCAYRTPPGPGEGPGGFAERLVAAAEDVAALPPGKMPAEAAMVEPLACVLNSLATTLVEPGARVAVIGNGLMGVLHARAAAAIGAEPTLVHTGPEPAGLAGAWQGPDLRLPEDLGAETSLPGAGEFDRVIVIRGLPESLPVATRLAAPGGLIGIYASRQIEISVPAPVMRRKELGFIAAASHRRVDFEAAAAKVGDGTVLVGDLIHRSFPLGQIEDALDFACETDSGRIMVVPNPGDDA